MRIGILTGGGDVPGLNACIKAVTLRAEEGGHDIVGIRRGWGGLLECDPDDPESVAANVIDLDAAAVRTIDRTGGTVLHTSRTNPAKVKVPDEPAFLREGPAGRGGPGPYATRPEGARPAEDRRDGADRRRRHAVPVARGGSPGRRDPEDDGQRRPRTDYCIGFSTAVTRTVIFIHQLRTSAGSHERLAVVEVFGRYSGETALIAAYLSGVERAIIGEVPFDVEKLADADGRQAVEPEPLRDDDDLRGRHHGRGADGPGRDRGRLRPPEARRDRRDHRRGAQGDHGRRHHLPAARLPDAVGPPGLAGPDGRDQLRRDGGRPGGQRRGRPPRRPATGTTSTCRSASSARG